MKSNHTYTIGKKSYAVNFVSGSIQDWIDTVGERSLYHLHTLCVAHYGQSWFKNLVERLAKPIKADSPQKLRTERARDLLAWRKIQKGEHINLFPLLPKGRVAKDWKEGLMTRCTAAFKTGGKPAFKAVKDAYFNSIQDEAERSFALAEYVEFLLNGG